LGSGRHDFGAFFATDGVIDVNGTVAQGQKAIEDVYAKAAAATPPEPGVFRMLLSNISIVVNGDKATADAIWTGVQSANVHATPRNVEQGREHDELVKLQGRWLFKHRVISSDGGLDPKSYFAKTYKKR
ncbi:MAG: nuclear transport factor 2 family protein, partial [Steroidobacteraceae bacterium]